MNVHKFYCYIVRSRSFYFLTLEESQHRYSTNCYPCDGTCGSGYTVAGARWWSGRRGNRTECGLRGRLNNVLPWLFAGYLACLGLNFPPYLKASVYV